MSRYSFTEIQRLVLTILEEAKNENIATLINTVSKNSGRQSEIQEMKPALTDLLEWGLISIVSYSKDAQQWSPLNEADSVSFLLSIDTYLTWSDEKRAWVIQGEDNLLEIALTEVGVKEADQILKKEGYPIYPGTHIS